jgi:GNAT superfamily N-acetyltransferase
VAANDVGIVGWLEGAHRSPYAWQRFHDLPEDGGGTSCSFVDFLFVEAGNRRANIGSKLLTAFETEAVDFGNDFMGLSLDSADHLQAQAFYRAHGYTRSKSILYGHLMGKTL